MVAERWLLRMGNQVSSNVKHALLLENSKKLNSKKQVIGILSFEVASVMSRIIQLYSSLSDHEVHKLKNEILKCVGIRTLVSDDETRLLELALVEKLDDLGRISSVVSRLGKKCSIPALQGFEHVYGDVTSGAIDVKELGFLVKDMDGMVRKMERYVNSTASLYGEMVVLNELEVATRKFQHNHHEESRKAYEQKLAWQKQDVRHLKDVSLWNQDYDKIVELLARTLCTVYARISTVFGNRIVRKVLLSSVGSTQFEYGGGLHQAKSGQVDRECMPFDTTKRVMSKKNNCSHSGGHIGRRTVERRNASYHPQNGLQRSEPGFFCPDDFNFACGMGPGRLFMECISSSSALKDDDDDDDVGTNNGTSQRYCSVSSGMRMEQPNFPGCFSCSSSDVPFSGQGSMSNNARFGPRNKVTLYTCPRTVGGSALALHYANVIIAIEKLLCYPHLVGDEAKDDLYQLLPSSLRKTLKANLKSYMKGLAIYDAPLAHDWKQRLDEILQWLAPLAYNTIRWHSEHNVEQHEIVKKTNVLLLQTLYFGNLEKTEAAICELLLGLNYICRYEHQQNALLDYASSLDFEDCAEWQLQVRASLHN
ncbi:uncharacterized protein LOC116003194 [Ipomoea triloba]|uniref:uncharacterized protein LOC116003194 n=1 Tax=Ipomoea triloba TaxID=35885 RepID=UPI00125E3D85|nr:uncharacterized protein LOC116003194 [Ipomoea triloba]